MQLLRIIRERANRSMQEMADLIGMRGWGNYSRAETEGESLRIDFLYRALLIGRNEIGMSDTELIDLIGEDAKQIEETKGSKNRTIQIKR